MPVSQFREIVEDPQQEHKRPT